MAEFVSPDWNSPLDAEAELRRVPEAATQKGMFMIPMVATAKKRGVVLPSARARYLPFQDYPLREHAQLLVEAASAFFPEVSLRTGLRRLGRGGHAAFVESTVGKVVWATATDADAALDALAKAYEISVHGCKARVVERSRGSARVALSGVYYFLDCHHVGVFEGGLRSIGVEADVKIRLDDFSSGELLVTY